LFFLEKSTKTAATRAALFDTNMHQFLGLGFASDLTVGGAYSAPPDSLAVFRGLLLKGGEEREGVRPLPWEEERKVRRLCSSGV